MSDRKCVIVTGGGSGIGTATCLLFAKNGYDVVVNFSRNQSGADQVAEQCRAAGVAAITAAGDIASDDACRAIAAAAMREFGRIDTLVNNAGVTRYAQADNLDASNAADFQHIFSVNVIGTYQMIRAAEAHLKQSPAGSIVNVSSDSAISGSGSSLAYASSKGAVNTMTIGLARSLAPHIRVNAVCPSFVDTTWALSWHTDASYKAFKTQLRDAAPLKTMPIAEDVADTIFWLADHARKVTGQCIVVDSGAHLLAT